MKFQISFTLGTFSDTGKAFRFISAFIKRAATAIDSTATYSEGAWIIDDDKIEEDLSTGNDLLFSLHDGKDIYSDFVETNRVTYRKDPYYETELFLIEVIDELFIDMENLLKEAGIFKFNTAQRFDFWKARWQSELFPSNFESSGISYKNRRLISHPLWFKRDGLIIDIRQNPGREIPTHNMRLMAAPEMWFGPGAWGVFEINNILNCKDTLETKEIFPGVVYVKLFDPETEDYETPEILSYQQAFRKCSKMDEIEDLLNGKLSHATYY